jgi:hypothetical protein
MDRDWTPPKRARVVTAWVACAAAAVLCAGPARAEMTRKDIGTPITLTTGTMELRLGGSIDEIIRIGGNGVSSGTQFLNNGAYPNNVYIRGRTKNDYGNGMSWGFKLETTVPTNPSDQADIPDEIGNRSTETRSGYVWWDSGKNGKVKLGFQPGFNRWAGRVDLSNTRHAQNNDNRRWAGIDVTDGTGSLGVTAGELFRDYEPARGGGITYYSPEFSGFRVGATLGNDDAWQFGARYSGTLQGGMQAKAALGYNRNVENATQISAGANSEAEDSWVASGSVLLPTGLSITGAYGLQHPAAANQFTNFAYYAKAGYALSENQGVSIDYGFSRGTFESAAFKIFGERYGIGWERNFMPYIVYANLERIQGDRQAPGGGEADPVDVVTSGIRIEF